MGRFDEAAAHYQRCLEDQAIPRARLARAHYDFGTALVQADTRDPRRLEQAIAAFRRCLESQPAADLRTDALANLELAKWLWLQAKPSRNAEPPDGADESPERPVHADPRGGNDAARTLGNAPGMAPMRTELVDSIVAMPGQHFYTMQISGLPVVSQPQQGRAEAAQRPAAS